MIFHDTRVEGAVLVDIDPLGDDRGFFARTFCSREFAERGLDERLVQCSMSHTALRGTLRGLHYQVPPHEEHKLVRCTRGAIYDVAVDLRPESPTFLSHVAVELTEENNRALYIPAGCAHGFQTLTDDAHVFYQMSAHYEPAAGRGVRWNDPVFGITWPIAEPRLHARDASYADFVPGVPR